MKVSELHAIKFSSEFIISEQDNGINIQNMPNCSHTTAHCLLHYISFICQRRNIKVQVIYKLSLLNRKTISQQKLSICKHVKGQYIARISIRSRFNCLPNLPKQTT